MNEAPSMQQAPSVSVITVVFNAAPHLKATLESVRNQSYPHIQHVVVDGGSTDGTVDILRKFPHCEWTSEPDRGLYDAMNKGLRKATGEYVWFLNAGDRLYDEQTVEEVILGLPSLPGDGRNPGWPDVVYGATLIIDGEGKDVGGRRLKEPDRLTWRSFREGMVVCHQSMLVRRSLAPEYDTRYRIAADIDWAIRATRSARFIHHVPRILSRFMEGGLSGRNIRHSLGERFRIMTRYYGFVPTLFRHVLFGFRLTGFYLRHRRIS
ncbi:MAG: glycosyltransferase family 2 protein [Bacteroidales bacterium]